MFNVLFTVKTSNVLIPVVNFHAYMIVSTYYIDTNSEMDNYRVYTHVYYIIYILLCNKQKRGIHIHTRIG